MTRKPKNANGVEPVVTPQEPGGPVEVAVPTTEGQVAESTTAGNALPLQQPGEAPAPKRRTRAPARPRATRKPAEQTEALEQRQAALEIARRELEAGSTRVLDEMRQELERLRQTTQEARQELEAIRQEHQQLRESSPRQRASVTPTATGEGEGSGQAEPEEVVIQATLRTEGPGERVVRYLQAAQAVKAEVLDELQNLADESIDQDLRATFAGHRRLTQRQKQELEDRLRALGAEPANGKGTYQRLTGWVWGSWQREPDDYDRTIQNLLKAMSGQQFEVAMHWSLASLATATGDMETADLSGQHAREKRQAVEELEPFLQTLPEQAAYVAEAMQQAVVAMAASGEK
jgi:hypothetical protein